ncbi:MAG TPA: S9 family peptidase [Gemmatimonadales bacterium]|nr:S9 family peptidase [Gemmatimonadales bacterium]
MPTPPLAPTRPHVHDLHGEQRDDPYFWLREKDDPAVRAYLEAENAYADEVLAPIAGFREALYQEMLGRIKQTDLSVPHRDGAYWYYSRTEEGKQYSIHCRKRGSLEAAEEVLLDVNQLAEGHEYMALGLVKVSDDDRLLLYSTDQTGFREYTLRLKDLTTGQVLPLEVPKVTSAVWTADSRTILYTVEDEAKRSYRLYRHRLGTDDHHLVYEERDERFRVGIGRGRNRRLLYLGVTSHTTSEWHWLPADHPDRPLTVILPRRQDIEYDVDDRGEELWLRINDTGRNFRLVIGPRDRIGDQGTWREVLPHRAGTMLEGVDLFADFWVAVERRDGLARLRVTVDGVGTHEVEFPEQVWDAWPGTNVEWDATTYRFGYTSLITPSSVFQYDPRTRTRELLKQQEVLGGYDPSRYETLRLTARAEDGTAIPVSLVKRKDVPRDGTAPGLLEGYGAYGFPFPIVFSSARLSLLDRGVVVAIAHVRGGGDLGKPWHDAGRMRNKINTFTDFIACADHLAAERWMSPDRIGASGGSAGGLLMGAVVNLRPDRWRAVVLAVPFLDVLTTMLDTDLPLTVGEFEEWGDPRDPGDYAYMRRYSPYDNLRAGAYPAMLVDTSLNDSQVMYWEPAKYVARLRTLKTDDRPLLLVTNLGAGHGGASGRYDRLKEIARDYGFLLWQLGAIS